MEYGNNLPWFLSELANADEDQLGDGAIEVYGENDQGQEGSVEIEITDLASAASTRILELESQLNWLLSKVGIDEAGVYLAAGNSKLDNELSLSNLSKIINKS
ncbi:hypothetical protein HWV00_21025 (plasmid) [Moritella sp. 24]|uniref:hypothetical protein n=1 Tax=Moritella sp. 24 TaxID=2746230 RepID=UPI001BABA4B4|nr:hypothetical protein [Moritella sp. 24]QUM78758.1 hypothetical protein HWV00_21025 [Moritella sp. 24]